MVLCDVPLPLAVPFGYFPFTSKYSSGVIFPTFGDDYNKASTCATVVIISRSATMPTLP